MKALNGFVNQVGTQLVNRYCLWLERALAGSQFYPCTLTHVSAVLETSFEVHSSTSSAEKRRHDGATNLSTAFSSMPPTPPAKGSGGRFKMARQ